MVNLYLKALLGLILTVAVIYLGNTRLGSLPPICKFVDPHHGFWQNAEFSGDSLGQIDIDFELLHDEVKVVFEERGVPHIFTENDHDLYFLQGYLTARHRLWQMEFQTHAAAGRISELVGEKALNHDLEQRRIGMVWAAENALEYFSDDSLSRSVLDAYTEGINYFITSLDENDVPLEYKLLDYKPEKWTHLKSALLLKYMAKMLTGSERDRPNTEALKLLGNDLFRLLYPEQNYLPDPVVPKFNPDTSQATDKQTKPFLSDASWAMKDMQPHFVGSNNWAVSGSRTENGSAILCNDPHLRLSLPSIWYEIQIHAPGVNCYGVSLPGAPGVIIGFNDRIAWGITNSGRDVKDYYSVEFKSDDQKEYKYGDEWKTTSYRVEEIKIRGEESVFDTVIYTHYGPISHID
nr:penicillin acylase family protein [Flavobacteriales bacterium]